LKGSGSVTALRLERASFFAVVPFGSGVVVAESTGLSARHARRASAAKAKRCHGRFAISCIVKPMTPFGAPGGTPGSGIGALRCCAKSSSFVPTYGSLFERSAKRMHPSA